VTGSGMAARTGCAGAGDRLRGGLVRKAVCAAGAVMALSWGLPGAALAASNVEPEAVVRAVLFYSPSCPHCHLVMTETLPPLKARYGDRLAILAVNVSETYGAQLYDAAATTYQVPEERLGVPALFVADTVLVGSAEIPERFPSLVEGLLRGGGCDWPAIPGLAEAMAPLPSSSPGGASPAAQPASQPQDSIFSEAFDRAAVDPAGSALSVAVLLGLLAALAWAGMTLRGALAASPGVPSAWILPIGLGGLAVAAYLAAVETTASSAICGPVGDCNRVHESEYARLLGVLPIGVLGCLGYLGILGSWLVGRVGTGTPARLARLGVFALATFGVLFSAYLTFLEPFVIGATCGWCLASAVAMGAILLLAASSMWPPAPARLSARARYSGSRS
jgi:uncharacterized membrane protein/thiol-disulfide isomerase/thioredoxin